MIEPGQQFGRLTVLRLSIRRDPDGKRRCSLCQCACGRKKIARNQSLRKGNTSHCGCAPPERKKKHGGCGTPEYVAWHNMLSRCYNPRSQKWADYGGRGITVFFGWRSSGFLCRGFARFLADVGPRPGPEYSLDRIRVNEGYYPGNVRWATAETQANNKRRNLPVTDESEEF